MLAPTGRDALGRRRSRPRCGDRALRLRPGLCVLCDRGDDRRRDRHGSERRAGPRARAGDAAGATALAAGIRPSRPAVLRERVTSKGGTTHAALERARSRPASRPASRRPCKAAQRRAAELGDDRQIGAAPTLPAQSEPPAPPTTPAEHREPDPVVQPECLEAAVAAAVADQREMPGGDRRRRRSSPAKNGQRQPELRADRRPDRDETAHRTPSPRRRRSARA